jgi:hypothetical protein
MGNFVGSGFGSAGTRVESVFHAGHIAHHHLRTFDHRDHAAERRGCGPGGGFRRRGQPDGVRPARSGHISFQSDNVVRDHVHAHIHGVDHAPEFDGGVNRQFRVATVLEDVKATGACGSGLNTTGVSASPGRSCSSSACAIEISQVGQNLAADREPRNTKFFHLTPCGSGGTGRRTILRGWRRKAWGFESPLPHQNTAIDRT